MTGICYLVLLRCRQILLQLRRGTDHWDGYYSAAAAGRIESGEDPLDAVRREAREELGLILRPGDVRPLPAGVGAPSEIRRSDSVRHFYFLCGWDDAMEPMLREPDLAAELRWFNLDALPVNTVPHEAEVYRSL